MFYFFLKSFFCTKLQSIKPDLIIADSVHPLGALTGLWFSIIKKCPFIYQIRDIWPLALHFEGKLSKINPLYLIFEVIQTICIKKCAFVLSSLKHYKKFLTKNKINKKVIWIPNPIDKTITKSIKNKPNTFLYIGGFGYAHDVEAVIKGISCFQAKYKNKARFVFVGNGVKKAASEKMAAKNNLKNYFFYQYRRKKFLAPILNKCHIGIAALFKNQIYEYGINLNKVNSYLSHSIPVIFSGDFKNNEIKKYRLGSTVASDDSNGFAKKIKMFVDMTPKKYNALSKRIFIYAKKTRNLTKLQNKILFHIKPLLKNKS